MKKLLLAIILTVGTFSSIQAETNKESLETIHMMADIINSTAIGCDVNMNMSGYEAITSEDCLKYHKLFADEFIPMWIENCKRMMAKHVSYERKEIKFTCSESMTTKYRYLFKAQKKMSMLIKLNK